MPPQQFAISVVEKLQHAGFEALWAGGCVRDLLLDRPPQDYDVATNARPEQIRELFGQRRTLAIGAAFGVITVLSPKSGPQSAGQVEVATFRRDGGYSDGRRPDSVEFSDAQEDAIRRDFTINGMFYDPLSKTVMDYVGGETDLAAGLIRAIGNPHERIEEDKLRMLRGIRFAATFDFEIEPETWAAIKKHASEIGVVSPERIGAEVTRMLTDKNRASAARRLLESGLLNEILPSGSKGWRSTDSWSEVNWELRFAELERLKTHDLEPAIYLLLRDYWDGDSTDNQPTIEVLAKQLQGAWRLKNDGRDRIVWIGNHWQTLLVAESRPWSRIQPLLVSGSAGLALDTATAITGTSPGIAYCRERLAWPAEELDPPPLIDGQDLIKLKIYPGPQFKHLLAAVRDRQLDGELATAAAAVEFVKMMLRK
jgi:poly(A) polymerase